MFNIYAHIGILAGTTEFVSFDESLLVRSLRGALMEISVYKNSHPL